MINFVKSEETQKKHVCIKSTKTLPYLPHVCEVKEGVLEERFLYEWPLDRMQLSKALGARNVNCSLGSNTSELVEVAPFPFSFLMQKLIRSGSKILSSFNLLFFKLIVSWVAVSDILAMGQSWTTRFQWKEISFFECKQSKISLYLDVSLLRRKESVKGSPRKRILPGNRVWKEEPSIINSYAISDANMTPRQAEDFGEHGGSPECSVHRPAPAPSQSLPKIL